MLQDLRYCTTYYNYKIYATHKFWANFTFVTRHVFVNLIKVQTFNR